jgi:hypothetical protein
VIADVQDYGQVDDLGGVGARTDLAQIARSTSRERSRSPTNMFHPSESVPTMAA